MAKKKKSNISESKSKRDIKKPINPFEVHINRQKFNVLNVRMKTDRGLPGVARAKALKKRKETLLQEYKILNKANKFHDRRIGERNSAMTSEDRIIARFSAERMKSHRRKDIFNLAEDEILTHKGQSISEIEKFDDTFNDDDDYEGDAKGLDAKFVEEANFGGGVLKESKTNRATIIEQLIAESKKRKAERQMAREKTLQKTEELDAEWKELIPIVNMGKHDEQIEKKDSYDRILSELKFEPRGTPTDKLKTEVEIAEEEARKLKELEEERLRRMRGDDSPAIRLKNQHRSADDLDDGFQIEEDDFELTYDQDGKVVEFDKDQGMKKEGLNNLKGNAPESDEESEESGSEAEESDTADSGEEDADRHISKDDGNKSDSGEDADDLSDLQIDPTKEKDVSDSETETELEPSLVQTDIKKGSIPQLDKTDKSESQEKEKKKVSFGEKLVLTYDENSPTLKKTPEQLEKDEKERLLEMEKALKELPYFFEAPRSYEELQDILKNKSLVQQAVVIERMIKCNHPSLNERNKEKLENLFALLMQLLNDSQPSESWSLLNRLAPYLFDLAQFSPGNAAFCLSEVLLEKHSDYLKKKNKYPASETFLFLKLVPLLFPTSDKRHSVTTPAFIFIAEMLHHCTVTTRRAIASGLFLVSLFTEYVCLSKRILPEVFNFLCGIIHLATPATNLQVVPPFKKEHKFLFIHNYFDSRNDLNLNMQSSELAPKPACKIDDIFRIKSIGCALKLLKMLANIYEGLPACKLLFEPIKKHLEVIEIDKYPESIQHTHHQLTQILNGIFKKELTPVIMEAKKPKALRLYEPLIKPVYDMKNRNLPPAKAEHAKLLYKYKKEMKGAVREIRRDREFISKLKFREQATSDAERKRKVKEIYSWGAQQQCEFKKMKRKK